MDLANRYPGGQKGELTTKFAAHMGVDEDQIVWGAGSTEVLQMIVQAYAQPRANLITAEPTFEDVPRYRMNHPYNLITVPITADYQHDLTRMREEAEADGRPGIVYFCNPNNPTGTITSSQDIDNWISDAPDNLIFLMDEAYYEYVDDPRYWSALKWIDDKPNVIVVRTFSKIYGMAGLRLGYGLAHAETATRLNDFVANSNTNQLAMAAATASLDDEGLVARSIQVNDEAKAITIATLDELGLEHLPTQCNFLMHEINGDLGTYIDRMAERGMLVGRQFPPMLGYNRLSFSMPEHMEQWADNLKDFRQRGWV
jgi:histidinol-phosphate aminotransferase